MKTKIIGIWNGNNFIELVNLIAEVDEDLLVHILYGKFIIRDSFTGFYLCVVIGDSVEIPDYS